MTYFLTGNPQYHRDAPRLPSEGSFADRPGLVEVDVARAACPSGQCLRLQLGGVRRQVGIDGVAVEVGGKLHLQPGLLRGQISLAPYRVFRDARSALQRLLEHPSLNAGHLEVENARDRRRDVDVPRGKRVIKARLEVRSIGHQGNMRI